MTRKRCHDSLVPDDLHTQLQDLLDQVWRREAEWRLVIGSMPLRLRL